MVSDSTTGTALLQRPKMNVESVASCVFPPPTIPVLPLAGSQWVGGKVELASGASGAPDEPT